jgi:hypothetical protein
LLEKNGLAGQCFEHRYVRETLVKYIGAKLAIRLLSLMVSGTDL